jgi:hypothetical protein
MDLKAETDGLDGNFSKKKVVLRKMELKMDFRCESFSILKKCINSNQTTTWQVEALIPCSTT